ncbi:MAG: spondin domain-containing protein [Gammaproteobacteria bacterium]|nr:spondin domain-containing protein [Gammaproteobacteria bacterium]
MPRAALLSILGIALLGSTVLLNSRTALADEGFRVQVTITNITRGQVISPVVVASHSAEFEPLFQLGTPASAELAAVAEDAILDPLIASLSGDPAVFDVQTLFGEDGPIIPGESASVIVDIKGNYRYLSMAGMLVTTNDAFFAVRGARVFAHGTSTHHSSAYDAGSEANTENCDHIPGPPCGNAEVRVPDGSEGYVHIHAGVHGIADLVPSMHDWRNPVAEITVTRLTGK